MVVRYCKSAFSLDSVSGYFGKWEVSAGLDSRGHSSLCGAQRSRVTPQIPPSETDRAVLLSRISDSPFRERSEAK